MIDLMIDELKNKKILILGLGREGLSTLRILQQYMPDKTISIFDINVDDIITKNFIDMNDLEIIKGDITKEMLDDFDIVFKTPGICFKNIDLTDVVDKITSQLEMFLKYYNGKVVGVTGTKGKSTTVSLIYHIISKNTDNTVLVGNIGIPIFDKIENINNDTIVIIEMSSHQLEFVKHSPYIAVLLNIFEEHLDHYKSYDAYINAKLNIFCNNKQTKFAIYNMKLEEKIKTYNIKNNIAVDFNEISKSNYIFNKGKISYDFKSEIRLLGVHNKYNIVIALEVLNALDIEITKLSKTISSFKSLPNRLEYVGEYRGIFFYNDSISTIPETTISCMATLKNLETIIIGGFDRGIDYTSLIEAINKNETLKTIICLPTTGHKIANKLKNNINHKIITVKNIEEAVKEAYQNTDLNKTCALSPAASSYNQFVNFEQRGDKFKEYIYKYSKI